MNQRWSYLSERTIFAIKALLIFSGALLALLGLWCYDSALGLWLFLLALVLYVAAFALLSRFLQKPYEEAEKLTGLLAEGYTDWDDRGLCAISPATESALQTLYAMRNTGDLIGASMRQAQYLALQNQINPHFLYNTLEGIRGEALSAGLDHVAQMTEALATFFRYTISNMEDLVTVEAELSNIENYYLIQQYRFGQRIHLEINCDEEDRAEIYQCRIPKLTLQPIVENSIVHGIESKVGRGHLWIRFHLTQKRLIITVSDDGVGMEADVVEKLNRQLGKIRLNSGHSEGKGGIALVNVSNRIKLLFGEQYGLCVYSTSGTGTDVEVTLPLTKKPRRVTG